MVRICLSFRMLSQPILLWSIPFMYDGNPFSCLKGGQLTQHTWQECTWLISTGPKKGPCRRVFTQCTPQRLPSCNQAFVNANMYPL